MPDASDKQANPPPDQQTFGWQGLTWQAPAHWTVGAVSGDYKEGYLRVDGSNSPRLELRWHQSPQGADLAATVDRYLRGLANPRKGQPAEVDRDARFLSRRKLGQSVMQTFAWRGHAEGYGVAWWCKQCGRVVLAQVLGQPQEPRLEQRAVQVLTSIRDHPQGEWVTWALYDLHTEVPQDFELVNTVLRAGLTQLTFKRPPERLHVARWGMAETALRGRTLEAWAQEQFWKEFRQFGPAGRSITVGEHEGYLVTGETVRALGPWIRVGAHLARRRYADQLVAYLWHCPPTNRIYVVWGTVDAQNRELLEQVRDRTRCHQPS